MPYTHAQLACTYMHTQYIQVDTHHTTYVYVCMHTHTHTHTHTYTLPVLIITASHQTFSGKFWCLSGQNKFDLTHLLYIINGKVSVFLEDKVMS